MADDSFLSKVIPGVGIATGIIGAIGSIFGNHKANKQLQALQASDPSYATSTAGIANQALVNQRLGLAKTMLNARAPGAAAAERNIYGATANLDANIDRGATDSSQALLLKTQAAGQEANQFNNLNQNEIQDYQRRYGNYTGAEAGVINENEKVFQDDTRRFGDRAQIQGAQNANRQNSWQTISNGGFALADFAANGGFGGNGSNNGMSSGFNPPRNGFNRQGYATGVFQ